MFKKLFLALITTLTLSTTTIYSIQAKSIWAEISNTCIFTSFKFGILYALPSLLYSNSSTITKLATPTTSGFVSAVMGSITSEVLCFALSKHFPANKKNTNKKAILLTTAKGISICLGTGIGLMSLALNVAGYSLDDFIRAQ